LNALFGVVVGALSVVSPVAAAGAFKVDPSPESLLALIRMFGGLLLASGLVSGLVAKDPDASPALSRTYAICLLVNVSADVAVIASHEMTFGQVGSGMVLEAVLAVLLFAYKGKTVVHAVND
jgi:hypothetical protein